MPKRKPLIEPQYWEIQVLMDKLVEEGKMGKEPDENTVSGFRYIIFDSWGERRTNNETVD